MLNHNCAVRGVTEPHPLAHQARKRANYIKSADKPSGTQVCGTLDPTVYS